MNNFHAALVNPYIGQVVYGRHPLTGEKFPSEKYKITRISRNMVEGESIHLIDSNGRKSESSSLFLCK